MKIVVFKGGLGNQLFQYAFYKYLSRKDETFYFYNDAWYNVSHNGFELDKYFKTDDLKKCSRFWIILFKTILSKCILKLQLSMILIKIIPLENICSRFCRVSIS